jgi:hypothetical protein
MTCIQRFGAANLELFRADMVWFAYELGVIQRPCETPIRRLMTGHDGDINQHSNTHENYEDQTVP